MDAEIQEKGTFLDHFIYQKPALISPTAHAGFRKGIRPYTKYIVGYELYLDENTTFDDQEQWPAMAARYVIKSLNSVTNKETIFDLDFCRGQRSYLGIVDLDFF